MCVQRYRKKMDFICSDLNLHVVLSGLQHKTFIINLWIEPFVTFTSYTGTKLVLSRRLPSARILKQCKKGDDEKEKES